MTNFFTKTLIAALNIGVILTAAHGALAASAPVGSTTEFATKVNSELHTHSDTTSMHKPMNDNYLDPKSLRRVRSEGDKSSDSGDPYFGGWDVYDGWVGLSS